MALNKPDLSQLGLSVSLLRCCQCGSFLKRKLLEPCLKVAMFIYARTGKKVRINLFESQSMKTPRANEFGLMLPEGLMGRECMFSG